MQQVSSEAIVQLLESNGFARHEAETYIAILMLKKSNAIQIAEYVKADKTTIYRAIDKLSKLGLIASTGGRYNNLLFVKDVTKLQSHLERKKNNLDQGLELLNQFIAELPATTNLEYLRSKIIVLEGVEAIKDLYDMRSDEPNTLIREISSGPVFAGLKLYGKPSWDNDSYWEGIIAQRKKNGCFLNQLVDQQDLDTTYHRTDTAQI